MRFLPYSLSGKSSIPLRRDSVRSIREGVWISLCHASTVLSLSILVIALFLLARAGWSVLDVDFFFGTWQHRNIAEGGIAQAIMGSLYLGLGVLFISFPLGIGTAIFLTEYSADRTARRTVQLAIRNLAGVPSVVYGLFGLTLFVQLLNFGSSLLAAICTLSAMTLPWVITASVEALEAVPQKFRDSSLALGATHWQTTRRIVLPAGMPGCLTGGIISMARALGETAPIILVGATFFLSGFPGSPFDRFMALPYHTFILATQHASPDAPATAAGTALILLLLTFILSAGAILLRWRLRRQKVW
ncbi:phosphate ABC transporter permease PstA [Candidatus Peregrinibacteria bacterium]|nr:phosphate ABC transporter permease PstA [Candidatus Peregrinibacteria bacterium]